MEWSEMPIVSIQLEHHALEPVSALIVAFVSEYIAIIMFGSRYFNHKY
jgi:hypothetical protein